MNSLLNGNIIMVIPSLNSEKICHIFDFTESDLRIVICGIYGKSHSEKMMLSHIITGRKHCHQKTSKQLAQPMQDVFNLSVY